MSLGTGLRALPFELLAIIAGDLAMKDILSCAQVSRSWNAAWTEDDMSADLCRRYFPDLPLPRTYAAFSEASRRYLRRRAGLFTSSDCLTLQVPPIPPVPPATVPSALSMDFTQNAKGGRAMFHCLQGGIMVWSQGKRHIILYDLRTGRCEVVDIGKWGVELLFNTRAVRQGWDDTCLSIEDAVRVSKDLLLIVGSSLREKSSTTLCVNDLFH